MLFNTTSNNTPASAPLASQIPAPQIPASQIPAPQAPAPQSSPLDDLRDIHLPESIDQFPTAIGWWILLALIICSLAFIIYRSIKKHNALRYLRTAKLELDLLKREDGRSESIAQLSALLKRICLIYYPSKIVASLNGQVWWDFINNEARQNIFTQADIKLMSQSRYQKESIIDKIEYSNLIEKTEQCIELIVRKAIVQKSIKKNGVAQ